MRKLHAGAQIEDAGAPVEPAPAPASPGSDDSDVPKLGKPSAWGPFKLTVKQPSASAGRAFGGVEASCPFRKKNKRTGCKKYLQLRNASAEEFSKCVRSLKMWCNSARLYARQRQHLAHHIAIDSAPVQEIVDAGLIENGPTERVKDDDELDAAAGPAPVLEAKAKAGRGKAKAKGRARADGALRGRGRGRGRRPCVVVCFVVPSREAFE